MTSPGTLFRLGKEEREGLAVASIPILVATPSPLEDGSRDEPLAPGMSRISLSAWTLVATAQVTSWRLVMLTSSSTTVTCFRYISEAKAAIMTAWACPWKRFLMETIRQKGAGTWTSTSVGTAPLMDR